MDFTTLPKGTKVWNEQFNQIKAITDIVDGVDFPVICNNNCLDSYTWDGRSYTLGDVVLTMDIPNGNTSDTKVSHPVEIKKREFISTKSRINDMCKYLGYKLSYSDNIYIDHADIDYIKRLHGNHWRERIHIEEFEYSTTLIDDIYNFLSGQMAMLGIMPSIPVYDEDVEFECDNIDCDGEVIK